MDFGIEIRSTSINCDFDLLNILGEVESDNKALVKWDLGWEEENDGIEKLSFFSEQNVTSAIFWQNREINN